MRIVSWNVNGLRARAKKGFFEVLEHDCDVMCVQEVRAFPHQLPDEVRAPPGWFVSFFPAVRPGYSGVAIYSRIKPTSVVTSLGDEQFDIEGRFIMASFDRLSVASVYFPKGNGKERDNSRVPYKLAFYDAVKRVIDRRRRYGPVVVGGDYNADQFAK